MFEYLKTNWLELFAVVTSLVYLYFSINRKIWLWLLGILCSGIYVIVFFQSHLYADMLLNSYYVVISIYGFIKWISDRANYVRKKHEVMATCMHGKALLHVVYFFMISFIAVYIPVKFLPDLLGVNSASLPLIDSTLTALSFVATWMLAKRYIEQWIFWIFINTAYMGLYWYKGLYMTIFLSFVYASMSVVGYIKWKKFVK